MYDTLPAIVIQVQDDLRSLRTTAQHCETGEGGRNKSGGNQALDSMLSRTEKNMQLLADKVMQNSHSEVATLPAVAPQHRTQHNHPPRQSRLKRRYTDFIFITGIGR